MTVNDPTDNTSPTPFPPVEATEAWWGFAETDRVTYRPLEEVHVCFAAPLRGADSYRVEWHDGLGRCYGSASGHLRESRATVVFRAGGEPGMQYIRIWFDPLDEDAPHDRLLNFTLEAHTEISCDNSDITEMYVLSRDSILLNRRRYRLDEGEVIGYTTADSGHNLDFWLRDMYYSLGGYCLWENDLTSGLEAIWARQRPDGHFPDWVDEDGQSERQSSESDVEYIAALALYRVWMITGDDDWLRSNLPSIEQGLEYLTTDPLRWDAQHRLIRRGHTCDTWDFDIDTEEYSADGSAVAATCDQSGLYLSWCVLSHIYDHLGDAARAEDCKEQAEALRLRCAKLLWDGEKFLHHLHLSDIDHGDFDESRQLAMGNTWAMTRGLADHQQCLAIMDTYQKRWRETGHRFPWWSLEPGYPIDLGRVLQRYSMYLCPGGYCNGGMMPWVGAALSSTAFIHGRETLAARLLTDYAQFLRQQGGKIYTWYWPGMQPGFRTTTQNTTGHDGWGMGHWMDSLVEGIAGLRILEPAISVVELSPRWPAAEIRSSKVTLCFPAVDRYVAYQYVADDAEVRMLITGTPGRIHLRIMLPSGQRAAGTLVNGKEVAVHSEHVEETSYATLTLTDGFMWDVQVKLET